MGIRRLARFSFWNAALLAALLLSSAFTHATTVTYAITGQVAFPAVGAGLFVGDPFNATLTYDANAQSTSLNAPTAIYSPATSEFTFSVGDNNRFQGMVAPGLDDLQVNNNGFNLGVGDRFRIRRAVAGNTVGSTTPLLLSFNLQDNSGDNTAFVGLDIPTVLTLTDYDMAFIDVEFSNGQVARIQITDLTAMSPVPLPAAAWFFGTALASLVAARRRYQITCA